MIRSLTAAFALLALTATLYAVPPGTHDEISARLQPFGEVCRAGESCGTAAVASAGGTLTGEEVYNQFCFACHAVGVSDAPRLGNADDWKPRLDKGLDALMASTVNGINAMPAKGTCMNCSDDELGAAVDYMLDQVE